MMIKTVNYTRNQRLPAVILDCCPSGNANLLSRKSFLADWFPLDSADTFQFDGQETWVLISDSSTSM